jgi:N-sulfoglucosamine sulfohydrolase
MNKENNQKRPNILFAFADDMGRYGSCYKGVKGASKVNDLINTPHFDRIAKEGVLFSNAHVPAPTCTPCRSSVLSGRYFWQTRLGAILSGAVFDNSIPTYTRVLGDAGYHLGFTYKVWGPGKDLNNSFYTEGNTYQDHGGRFNSFSFEATRAVEDGESIDKAMAPLYDEVRGNFNDFLEKRKDDQPFCYWWGPTNTHRAWLKGSGEKLWDIKPDTLKGKMPAFFPDTHDIREDFADYLGECMAVDRGLGVLIEELEARGELENTLIVVSGDHGIPGFPRAKANLYGIGSEVMLLARLPEVIPAGRRIDDCTNIKDLAPTFLDIAGVGKPESMTGQSLMPLLTSDKSGVIDEKQNFAVTGRERHVGHARQWNMPYPSRAIHTEEYTYIKNYKPDRWPAGDPKGMDDPNAPAIDWDLIQNRTYSCYPDFDASPTKAWLVHHRAEKDVSESYRLGFDKRPLEELYHNTLDQDQMNNLADNPDYTEIKEALAKKLKTILIEENDPREVEDECRFDLSPYTDCKLNAPKYIEAVAMSELRWDQS